MLLYGAGGHAKVVIDAAASAGIAIEGFFDDAENVSLGKSIHLGIYNPSLHPSSSIVISIGDNVTRRILSETIKHPIQSVIASSALLSPSVTVGGGSMILQRSVVQCDSVIGKHVIINTGSQVDHDCSIGNHVHIGPGAILCGNVTVGEGAFIGAGSVILPGVSIGRWSIVGAGSVVTRNVPDRMIVAGHPARAIKQVTHEME